MRQRRCNYQIVGNVLYPSSRLQLYGTWWTSLLTNSLLAIELPSSAHSSLLCRHCLNLHAHSYFCSVSPELLHQQWVLWRNKQRPVDCIQTDRHTAPLTTKTLLAFAPSLWSLFGTEKKFDFMSQLKVHYDTSCRAVQVLYSCSQ